VLIQPLNSGNRTSSAFLPRLEPIYHLEQSNDSFAKLSEYSRGMPPHGTYRRNCFLHLNEANQQALHDGSITNCLPGGPSETLNYMYRIIQSPNVIALLCVSGTGRYRQIYMLCDPFLACVLKSR
jgi:hypothetical protein